MSHIEVRGMNKITDLSEGIDILNHKGVARIKHCYIIDIRIIDSHRFHILTLQGTQKVLRSSVRHILFLRTAGVKSCCKNY